MLLLEGISGLLFDLPVDGFVDLGLEGLLVDWVPANWALGLVVDNSQEAVVAEDVLAWELARSDHDVHADRAVGIHLSLSLGGLGNLHNRDEFGFLHMLRIFIFQKC